MVVFRGEGGDPFRGFNCNSLQGSEALAYLFSAQVVLETRTPRRSSQLSFNPSWFKATLELQVYEGHDVDCFWGLSKSEKGVVSL